MPSWANASNAITTVTSSPGIDTNTIVESTTIRGVEVRRVTTEWATVIAPGASDSHTPEYQIVKRTTVDYQWAPFFFVNENGVSEVMPSTQLDYRWTVTEMLGGILADDTGTLWPDGSYYSSGRAAMIEVEKLTEQYSWRADCLIQSATITREQNYSPLAPESIISPPGHWLYADGTYRGSQVYTWREVSKDVVQYSPDGVGHSTISRWHLTAPDTESYGEVPLGTPDSSIAAIAEIADTAQPERGSSTIPQVSEEVISVEYDVTDACGYQRRREAPGLLPYPENEAELNTVAKRRIRRAFSLTLDIPHNLLPFLRVGDHVSVTNHARNLIKRSAYVVAIKRTINVLNGAARQVTTVKIPPSFI